MPISAVVADYDLYLALDAALSSDPQDFSAIPHLTFYNPENADDNEFIEVIVGLLTQRSADDQTSRALLDHICIRSVVVDEINIRQPLKMQIYPSKLDSKDFLIPNF